MTDLVHRLRARIDTLADEIDLLRQELARERRRGDKARDTLTRVRHELHGARRTTSNAQVRALLAERDRATLAQRLKRLKTKTATPERKAA